MAVIFEQQSSGLVGSLFRNISVTTVALGLVACFFLYWFITIIYTLYFHPLAKYPGPKLWAITRIPYAYYLQKGRLPQVVKGFHDKYGKIIRIAPDEVSFIDGRAWKDIYMPKNGQGPFDKWEIWLNKAVSGTYSILTAPTLHEHARIKRLLQHGFSDKALRAQETMFQGHVDTLISQVRKSIESGQKNLNMFNWFSWATADIMGDLAFGESFDCLREGRDHRWILILIEQFTTVLAITSLRFFAIPRRLMKMYMPPQMLTLAHEIHKYAVEKVDQRLAQDLERPDFAYYLGRENKDNEKLSRAELDTTMSALMVAGGETTAAFLSGITFYLVQHPEALHKLEDEVRAAFKDDSEINANATNNLPYFNACVKEGLRLSPAVPFGHPRLVPEGGGTIAGEHFPKGTKLTLMAYATYYSEANFKDAEKFVPERWLEWNGYDDQSAFEPFSLGPRNCIGKNLALVELRIILARVILNFNFALPEGQADMGWHWADQNIYMLWKCGPNIVKVTDARAPAIKA